MMASLKRLRKLENFEYRRSYLREMVGGWVVHQLRVLRKGRGWSQAELGKRACGRPQSSIGRIESEDYGNWNINTLIDLANAFDVALEVRFVPWSEFISRTSDLTSAAMSVDSFSKNDIYRAAKIDIIDIWKGDRDYLNEGQGLMKEFSVKFENFSFYDMNEDFFSEGFSPFERRATVRELSSGDLYAGRGMLQ